MACAGTLTEFHDILQLLIYAILKLLKFSNLLAYEFIKSHNLIISYERPVTRGLVLSRV